MTNAGFKDLVGKESMQYTDDGFKPLEQFEVSPLIFFKSLGLFLEYIKDRIGTVAALDLGGEWVVPEIFPSL